MSTITTASGLTAPTSPNLGAVPLHPLLPGYETIVAGIKKPASLARSNSSSNQNGTLNQATGGSLTPNVSDPSKSLKDA